MHMHNTAGLNDEEREREREEVDCGCFERVERERRCSQVQSRIKVCVRVGLELRSSPKWVAVSQELLSDKSCIKLLCNTTPKL